MTLKKRLDLILEDLKKYRPKKVILFGSALKRNVDEYSDIDLMVIKDKVKKNFVARLGEVANFIRPQLWPVDILVYSSEELKRMRNNPFINKVLKEGKVVYEKTPTERTGLVKTGRA